MDSLREDREGRLGTRVEMRRGPPVFVGRAQEMAGLLQRASEAREGRGSLVIISGEAGIGKSRIAAELAGRLEPEGTQILWGRCWEAGGAPAFWPWIQSMRSHIRSLADDELRPLLGEGAVEIAQLVPEVRARLALPGAVAEGDSARFRLFDAITSFLWSSAEDRPLVIVLDDLHASDTSSLMMLRFLAMQIERSRILLLALLRDTEAEPEDPLQDAIADIERAPRSIHLRLSGLGRDEVRSLIDSSGLPPASDDVVAAVREETNGNPLFLGEVVRLLIAEAEERAERDLDPWPLRVPEGLKGVIRKRIAKLSALTREALATASVFGREFEGARVASLLQVPIEEVLRRFESALAERLVLEVPGASGGLRFGHALIRDTFYEDLGPVLRADLHRRAAAILEGSAGASPDTTLTEIATHLYAAAPAGGASRAVSYARRAGHEARRKLAYEEAARLFDMALAALDLAPSDEDLRCDLLLDSGEARLLAGDTEGARQTYVRAADAARGREPSRFARAALGYGGRFVWLRAGKDARLIPLLREALEALPEEDSDLRARVMARLSGALRDQVDIKPRSELSRAAVAMSRRIGDPETLAYALVARFTADWRADNAEEQLETADELVELSRTIGNIDRAVEGHLIRVKALLSLGDTTRAAADIETSSSLVAELQQPAQQWYAAVDRVTLALLEGRFRAAEQLIPEVRELGLRALGSEAEASYRLQMLLLRSEQGRLEEVVELVQRGAEEYPWYPMFRCALTNVQVKVGQMAAARRGLDDLAAEDFSRIPFDQEWLFGLSFLAEVVYLLNDADRAAQIYALLEPYEHLHAYSPPELSLGPVGRYLGLLAATCGRLDAAEDHLTRARISARSVGALPWEAHALVDLAEVLLERREEGPARDAVGILEQALSICINIEMPALGAQAEEMLEVAHRKTTQPIVRSSDRDQQVSIFRRDGDYWSISFGGRIFRLHDAKGLGYIHALLQEPGREFHVADLAQRPTPDAGGESRPGASGMGLQSDLGPHLDAHARRAYEQRVTDLRAEVDEAERWGDDVRAGRARDELEFVAAELTSAYGLGGRVRRAGDPGERVRKAVTNRIRASLDRLGRESPELGRHLANSIHTGTFCSYMPDIPRVWRL